MKKKLSFILATSTLAAGLLTGCGAGSSSSEDEYKLGINMELSGPVATYGQSLESGIALAIDEINEAGGIDGKQIVPVKFDNKSDTTEATNGALKLIDQDKVSAIIGAATSGATIAQVQIANDKKTVLLAPAATAPNVTVNENGTLNDYAFRTSFIDPFQGTVAARFAIDELNVKNAAIFSDSASDYAKGLAAAFKKTFEENGGTIVSEVSYVAKDTDFSGTLTSLKGKNPEFIFIPGYYEEVGLIVKQAREMGITVPLMGADGWDSPKLVELAGAENLNNTFITNHYSSEDPDETIQKFVKAYSDKNKKSPDAFNALGYDSVYLLKDAIERAGTTDSVKVKEELEKTKDLSLITGEVTIDADHNPIKSATILEYQDGKQVFKTKVNP